MLKTTDKYNSLLAGLRWQSVERFCNQFNEKEKEIACYLNEHKETLTPNTVEKMYKDAIEEIGFSHTLDTMFVKTGKLSSKTILEMLRNHKKSTNNDIKENNVRFIRTILCATANGGISNAVINFTISNFAKEVNSVFTIFQKQMLNQKICSGQEEFDAKAYGVPFNTDTLDYIAERVLTDKLPKTKNGLFSPVLAIISNEQRIKDNLYNESMTEKNLTDICSNPFIENSIRNEAYDMGCDDKEIVFPTEYIKTTNYQRAAETIFNFGVLKNAKSNGNHKKSFMDACKYLSNQMMHHDFTGGCQLDFVYRCCPGAYKNPHVASVLKNLSLMSRNTVVLSAICDFHLEQYSSVFVNKTLPQKYKNEEMKNMLNKLSICCKAKEKSAFRITDYMMQTMDISKENQQQFCNIFEENIDKNIINILALLDATIPFLQNENVSKESVDRLYKAITQKNISINEMGEYGKNRYAIVICLAVANKLCDDKGLSNDTKQLFTNILKSDFRQVISGVTANQKNNTLDGVMVQMTKDYKACREILQKISEEVSGVSRNIGHLVNMYSDILEEYQKAGYDNSTFDITKNSKSYISEFVNDTVTDILSMSTDEVYLKLDEYNGNLKDALVWLSNFDREQENQKNEYYTTL